MILFDKFGQHQPLNRQSDRFAREGMSERLSLTINVRLAERLHAG